VLRSFACCWCVRSCADGYPARMESRCHSRCRRSRFIIPDRRFLFWIPSSTYALDARAWPRPGVLTQFLFLYQITVFYGTSAASEAMPPHSGSKLAQAIKDLRTSRPLVRRTRQHAARAYQHAFPAHTSTLFPRIPARFSRAYQHAFPAHTSTLTCCFRCRELCTFARATLERSSLLRA
jgi:hypothetical protein